MYIRYFLVVSVLFLSVSSYATSAIISEFKSHLFDLKSVAIDFTQNDTRGQSASGRLIIVKPDNFLCNYYEPYPIIISGNKSYVSIYDFDMDQVTLIESKDNMFNFLLTNNVDLEKHFDIIEATKTEKDLSVVLYHKESGRTTLVTISLGQKNMLKSIKTEEPDGNIITLDVQYIRSIGDVNKSLFVMKNPNIYGPPVRMNHKDLEKKYKILD